MVTREGRSQAVRLLAMAMRAREAGDSDLADLLTKRAMQYLEDGGDRAGHVSQQQQQPQPRKEVDD